MKNLFKAALCLLLSVSAPGIEAQTVSIIPKPAQIIAKESTLTLTPDMLIAYDAACKEQAEYLLQTVRRSTGFRWKEVGKKSRAGIVLEIDSLRVPAPEGYTLEVSGKRIAICGHDKSGVFYGIQTLLQLLPPAIYSASLQSDAKWSVPCISVADAPDHPWRGMMLDVARYFYDKDFVKKYIDMMAMYKMNKLQFHLIDDSGWRLEIKKYPRLTEVGAWAGKNEKRLGGFYTQEEIKDMIAYAAVRGVEIIPEIEFPAHMLSAVAAYPWLCCTGKQHEVPNQHFISRDLLCVGKESSYQFLADVLEETVALFPSKYINIGGDEAVYDRWQECPKCQAVLRREGLEKTSDLQGYLTNVVANMMKEKGKTVVGWEEIIQRGAVSQPVVAAIWHNVADTIQAARLGHKAILSPATHVYLDFPESRTPGEVKAATWMPPISLDKCYSMPTGEYAATGTVLGVQGCFWSDQFIHGTMLQEIAPLNENRSENYAEYLTFPRLLAVAELGWTRTDRRSWPDFRDRLSTHFARLDHKGCTYRVPEPRIVAEEETDGKVRFTLAPSVQGATIRYTTDGTYPHAHSAVYAAPVTVDSKSDFRAITEITPRHASLPLYFAPDYSAYARYGAFLAEWKSQQLASGTLRIESTGAMVGNGTFDITFVRTRGSGRLRLGRLMQLKREERLAEVPMQAVLDTATSAVTYRLTQTAFEAGLPFFLEVEAAPEGDIAGYVFVKQVQQ